MMSKITAAILLLAATLSCCNAQHELSEELRQNIDTRVLNGQNTGIVVGLVENDQITYYCAGVKSLKNNEPVDQNSIFEIGSITKVFTGIILADQVIKGNMQLDDPIQQYLPDGIIAPTLNGKSIRLVHLANHTSGLPRMPSNFAPANPENPYADYTSELMYDFLNEYELSRDIGSQYEYSNYAMGLLGHLMSSYHNQDYEDLMIDVIAKPLKLRNTRISLTPKMNKNLAMGHSMGKEVENWDIPTLAGAGFIRSTASDMISFLRYNMGFQQHKLYEAMQLAHKNSGPTDSSPIVGLGWHTLISDDKEIVWHNGGTGGYRSFTGFVKNEKKGVIVLTNSNVGVDDIGLHILNPNSPLREVKPYISIKIRELIDTKGLDEAIKTYRKIKKSAHDNYDFSEPILDQLGKEYLESGQLKTAIGLLELNLESYPESSNVYNSLGDAYFRQEQAEQAIVHYRKALALNPGNQNASQRLKDLGADLEDLVKDIVVETTILDRYIGKYQLAPGFFLIVSRDENQLNAQATGQQKFPVFPKSMNEFYYKVVEAQLTFNMTADGATESVTLYQGGREIVGKKL